MTPAESLEVLVADGIVDAVVQRVKSGKEAEVFVVRKGNDFLAAKVYKERNARNFKNNVGYKEGRTVRNTRDARALAKGSSYGKKLSENEWMHTEHDALVTVVNAGVRAPKAELFYDGILLMELVLDAAGQPAPRLMEVPLSAEEAVTYHRDIVGQIVRMLTCDLIHGDLSPFNILLAWNGPTIIDLPQVIKAAHNSQSEQFLVRDVRNVTEYFAKFAPVLKDRVYDGHAIWAKYTKRELAADYFPAEGEGVAARPIDDGRRRHQGRQQGRPPPRQNPELAALAAHVKPATAAPAPVPQQRTESPHPHAPQKRAESPRPPASEQRAASPRPQSPRPNDGHRPAPQANAQPRPQGDRPPRGPRPDRPPRVDGPRNDRPPRVDGPRNDRPPRVDGPRNDRPPRTDGPRVERTPRSVPPRPPGPVIERVTRLVPASASSTNAPTVERSGSRFQNHHRNRRPPQ